MFKSKIVEDIRLNVACESVYQECLEGHQNQDVLAASNESIGMAIGVALLAFFAWLVSRIIKVFMIGKQISNLISEELKKLAHSGECKYTDVKKFNFVPLVGEEICRKCNWDGKKIFDEFEKQVENLAEMADGYRTISNIIQYFIENEKPIDGKLVRAIESLKTIVGNSTLPGGYQINVEIDNEHNRLNVSIIDPVSEIDTDEGRESVSEFKSAMFMSANYADRLFDELAREGEKVKKDAEKLKSNLEEKTKKLDEYDERRKQSGGGDHELSDREIKQLENLYFNGYQFSQDELKELDERISVDQAFRIVKKYIEFVKNVTGELTTKIIPLVETKSKAAIRQYIRICAMGNPIED